MSEAPRHVVMHYAGYRYGGIERVITLQVPLLRRLGWRVTLLVDGLPPPPEAHVPEDCEMVLLSPQGTGADPEARRRKFVDFLTAAKAGVYYEHSYRQVYEGGVDEDLRTARRLGMRVICHWHNSFSRYLEFKGDAVSRFRAMTETVDAVVCLSRVDACFFQMRGLKAAFIPNPADPELSGRTPPARAHPGHRLVWCGRFSDIKNPVDAVRIAGLVSREYPDTQLQFVGAPDGISEDRLRAEARKAGANVVFAGQVRDVYGLFDAADVFLSTSEVEGFLMVLLEAMACGLPVVCYDLPYLELLRLSDTILRVPQRDAVSAAKAICGLFGDADAYRRASAGSLASAKRYAATDLTAAYAALLDGDDLPRMTQETEMALALDELDAARCRRRRAFARTAMACLRTDLLDRRSQLAARAYRKLSQLLPARWGRLAAARAEGCHAASRFCGELREVGE